MNLLRRIFACPDCRVELAWQSDNVIECRECGRIFERNGKFINLMPQRNWIGKKDISKTARMEKWRERESEFIRENVYNGGISEVIHSWGHNIVEDFRGGGKDEAIILDLACGTGSHLPYFKKINSEILICIDIQEDLLKTCAQMDDDGKISCIIQGDNYYLPFSDGSIDEVLSIYALEHMDDLQRSLAEVHRVLSPEGHFYVAIPTEGFLWRLGRQVTTARIAKKKFGVNNYNEIVKLSHVSDAKKILSAVKQMFKIEKIKYFPFHVPIPDLNLVIAFKSAKLI